jgi:hypothetical protein
MAGNCVDIDVNTIAIIEKAMRILVTIPPLPRDVATEITPLFPWPADPPSWLRGALLGPGEDVADARIIGADDLETELGWPVSLFLVEVKGERRMVALYQFLEWGGAVLVRGSLDTPARARLLDALRRARPDFQRDEAICLADLLGGAEGVA